MDDKIASTIQAMCAVNTDQFFIFEFDFTGNHLFFKLLREPCRRDLLSWAHHLEMLTITVFFELVVLLGVCEIDDESEVQIFCLPIMLYKLFDRYALIGMFEICSRCFESHYTVLTW